MVDAPVAASTNGTPARTSPDREDARKDELARTLYRKVAQGYEIESESDTGAVLVMKGRPKWFGLSSTPSVRFELTVDERGNAKSRRL